MQLWQPCWNVLAKNRKACAEKMELEHEIVVYPMGNNLVKFNIWACWMDFWHTWRKRFSKIQNLHESQKTVIKLLHSKRFPVKVERSFGKRTKNIKQKSKCIKMFSILSQNDFPQNFSVDTLNAFWQFYHYIPSYGPKFSMESSTFSNFFSKHVFGTHRKQFWQTSRNDFAKKPKVFQTINLFSEFFSFRTFVSKGRRLFWPHCFKLLCQNSKIVCTTFGVKLWKY